MRNFKFILAGSTAIVGVLALSSAALAQTTPDNTSTGSPAGRQADQANQVEGVIVTGSRIPRPNLEQPTPVSVVSPQMLQDSGVINLGDVIAQQPALSAQATARSNSNSFGNAGGLDYADLRNLGSNRTLTLVDGKRHVAADPSTAAVDLNAIPPALVDHVEVITGGASAIYGSDAVSGVVNIILKKNFHGLEMEAQAGGLTRGSGRNYSAHATFGSNFADDRGNAAFTLLWDRNDGVMAHDIPSLHDYGTIVNPIYANGIPVPNDGKPDNLLVPYVLSEYIDENTVLLNGLTFDPLTAFTAGGQPVPQQVRQGYNSFAFGSFAGPCATCLSLEDYLVVVPKTERKGFATNLHYDIRPDLTFTLDAKYITTHVNDLVQPSYTFGDYQLQPDNAFITPAIRTILAPFAPADYPYIARFMSDFGARTLDITRQTYRIVPGLEGKFDAGFADVRWDASVNYGETQNKFIASGNRITGNFEAAIDAVIDPATGKPACRMNVPSAQGPGYVAPTGVTNASACVPYNVFGQQNTPAAIAYSTTTLQETQKLSQEVADLNFTFDTSRFLNLPGGPIAFAAGAEYRQEKVTDTPDALVKAGLTEVAPSPDFSGGFNVKEAYVEASVPILNGKRWVDELSIDGAYRTSDYSHAGSANAWKVSGIYAPVHSVKLRATYSEAVRAPNISEAFLPSSGTFFTVSDPCDIANVNANVNRAANCASQGLTNFHSNTNSSPPGTIAGNPNLHSEESQSYTFGAVWQPTFAPRLSMTADYYDIKIDKAILQVQAQDILDNCYDSANGLDPVYCGLFDRNPTTHDVSFVRSTFVNASALHTNGVEFQVNYSTSVADWTSRWAPTRGLDGRLTASLDANYLIKLRNFPFANDPSQLHILEGTVGYPRLKMLGQLTYAQGPLTLTWSARYIGRSANFNRDPSRADLSESTSVPFSEAVTYHNIVAHWRMDGWGQKSEVYLGVNNIFDEEPPLGVIAGNPTGADGSSAYDIGRYAFAGIRIRY